MGDIGRGLGQIGNVLFEIELRDRKASDLKQATTDAIGRQKSKDAVDAWKQNNDLKDHTAENFAKVWNETNQFDPSLYRDKHARAQAELLQEAERDSFIRSEAITASDARIKDTALATHDIYLLEPNEGNRDNYED